MRNVLRKKQNFKLSETKFCGWLKAWWSSASDILRDLTQQTCWGHAPIRLTVRNLVSQVSIPLGNSNMLIGHPLSSWTKSSRHECLSYSSSNPSYWVISPWNTFIFVDFPAKKQGNFPPQASPSALWPRTEWPGRSASGAPIFRGVPVDNPFPWRTGSWYNDQWVCNDIFWCLMGSGYNEFWWFEFIVGEWLCNSTFSCGPQMVPRFPDPVDRSPHFLGTVRGWKPNLGRFQSRFQRDQHHSGRLGKTSPFFPYNSDLHFLPETQNAFSTFPSYFFFKHPPTLFPASQHSLVQNCAILFSSQSTLVISRSHFCEQNPYFSYLDQL